MAEEPEDDTPTAPFWMATFSDMATLLLTFFVLIVAMSEVEVKKFKEALSFFQGRTGMMSYETVLPATQQNIARKSLAPTQEEVHSRSATFEELLRVLAEKDLDDLVQVNLTDRGLHIIITDSIMFRSGEAALLPKSQEILHVISSVMSDSDVNSVLVEGHTDNQPINTIRYPSNWELSAARAGSVVRFMLQQDTTLEADRYMAVGHGEFKPRGSNTTASGRAQNRRVEILYSWEPWQNKIPEIPIP